MINGVLNIYKEAGFTSHDVVAKLRGMIKQKKIGHTGTLDPAAEGVLPVCLGNATKLCDLLTDWDKTYEAVLLLGVATDTQDTTGQVLRECPVEADEETLREVVLSFKGAYAQVPPMYSALKVGGKKLYELAREGKEVERAARPVHIYEIELLDVKLPRARLRVTCSKGTYIRTLCHDIGERLGCGGCMEQLLRTRVGVFTLENSLCFSKLEELLCSGDGSFADPPQIRERLGDVLTPVDALFSEYDRCILKPEADRLIYHGNAFIERQIQKRLEGQREDQDGEARILVYDSLERFVGIYQFIQREGRYKPVKMFLDTQP